MRIFVFCTLLVLQACTEATNISTDTAHVTHEPEDALVCVFYRIQSESYYRGDNVSDFRYTLATSALRGLYGELPGDLDERIQKESMWNEIWDPDCGDDDQLAMTLRRVFTSVATAQPQKSEFEHFEGAVKSMLASIGDKYAIYYPVRSGWDVAYNLSVEHGNKPEAGYEATLLADGKITYIDIRRFTAGIHTLLVDELARNEALYINKPMIIDLRNTPGGDLKQTANLVDDLLSHGTIYETLPSSLRKERTADEQRPVRPSHGYILVNKGSASASEIFAGALQQDERFTVVGSAERTFGKGLVQTVYNKCQIAEEPFSWKMTTSEVTVAGRTMHGSGVAPDIVLDIDTIAASVCDAYAEVKNDKMLCLVMHTILDRKVANR